MEKQDVVVVEKKNTFWTVVKILLVVAVVCFIAAKIYQKIKKKKAAQLEAEADEDASLLDYSDEELEEENFEVDADAVIANAEDMQ